MGLSCSPTLTTCQLECNLTWVESIWKCTCFSLWWACLYLWPALTGWLVFLWDVCRLCCWHWNDALAEESFDSAGAHLSSFVVHWDWTAFAGALKFWKEKKCLRHRVPQPQMQLWNGSSETLPVLGHWGWTSQQWEVWICGDESWTPKACRSCRLPSSGITLLLRLGTLLRGSEGRERFVITTVLRNTSDGHYYYYYYAGLTPSSHNTNIRDRLARLANGNVYQEQCATIEAQPKLIKMTALK